MENFDKGWLSEEFKNRLDPNGEFVTTDPYYNPETTDGGNDWGYVIATSTQSNNVNTNTKTNQFFGIGSMGEMVGLTILHGMGHTAGYSHNALEENRFAGFMSSGSWLQIIITNQYKGNINALIKDTVSKRHDIIEQMKNRFEN